MASICSVRQSLLRFLYLFCLPFPFFLSTKTPPFIARVSDAKLHLVHLLVSLYVYYCANLSSCHYKYINKLKSNYLRPLVNFCISNIKFCDIM